MSGYVVGLTGPIGAGKSTVAALFRAKGARVLDADAIAKDEQVRGTVGYSAIVQRFGTGILGPDREIDRAKLAAVVFADPAALARLEAILHPRVVARVLEARAMTSNREVLVVEAIKLLEGMTHRLCDEIWVVLAPRTTLLERLGRDRGMAAGEAEARLAAQAGDAFYRERAKVVLVNDGDRDALAAAVEREWTGLLARARSARGS